MRNVLLHGQSSLSACLLLLLQAFLQQIVASCNKKFCLALMGSLRRQYHSLSLCSAFAPLSGEQLATRDFSCESAGGVAHSIAQPLVHFLELCSLKMSATVSAITYEHFAT